MGEEEEEEWELVGQHGYHCDQCEYIFVTVMNMRVHLSVVMITQDIIIQYLHLLGPVKLRLCGKIYLIIAGSCFQRQLYVNIVLYCTVLYSIL